MIKPNFLGIGVQKAGTTTLHDLLKQHPDIFLPKEKELHFFNNSENYKKGINWYLSNYFERDIKNKFIGEITPDYIYGAETPERIKKDLGDDLKFIIILRQPVERAYSQYLMFKTSGEFPDFKLSMEREESGVYNNGFIRRGLYFNQLSRFFKLFPKSNFCVILFDDFIRDPEGEAIKIFNFLGAKPIRVDLAHLNKSMDVKHRIFKIFYKNYMPLKIMRKIITPKSYINKSLKKIFLKQPESLTPEVKSYLTKKYFIDDIKKTEMILERDLTNWYTFN